MLFGAHDTSTFEVGTYEFEVSHIIVHPDWNPTTDDFDADIAILVTISAIDFTRSKYIRPICIQPSLNLANVIGVSAGWGVNENGTKTSEPTEVRMPVVDGYQCFAKNPSLARISSNRIFCAGSKDGSGPCNGDSGGGLYVFYENEGKYFLPGIVSSGIFNRAIQNCDLYNYVIYTNMNDFYDWLTNLC